MDAGSNHLLFGKEYTASESSQLAQNLAHEGLKEQTSVSTSSKAPSPAIEPKKLSVKQEKQQKKKEERRKAQVANPTLKAAASKTAQLKKITQQFNVAAKTQVKLPVDYYFSYCGKLIAKKAGERLKDDDPEIPGLAEQLQRENVYFKMHEDPVTSLNTWGSWNEAGTSSSSLPAPSPTPFTPAATPTSSFDRHGWPVGAGHVESDGWPAGPSAPPAHKVASDVHDSWAAAGPAPPANTSLCHRLLPSLP